MILCLAVPRIAPPSQACLRLAIMIPSRALPLCAPSCRFHVSIKYNSLPCPAKACLTQSCLPSPYHEYDYNFLAVPSQAFMHHSPPCLKHDYNTLPCYAPPGRVSLCHSIPRLFGDKSLLLEYDTLPSQAKPCPA